MYTNTKKRYPPPHHTHNGQFVIVSYKIIGWINESEKLEKSNRCRSILADDAAIRNKINKNKGLQSPRITINITDSQPTLSPTGRRASLS